jgi:hypothetical protein
MAIFDNIKSFLTKPNKLNTTQRTNTGLSVYGGQIESSEYERMTIDKKMKYYYDIRNSDCIASTAVDILKEPILASKIKIDPANKSKKAVEAAEYNQWQFDNIYKGPNYFKRHCLLGLELGNQMFEKVWQRGAYYNNKLTNIITKLVPIQQHSINQYRYNEDGEFIGIEFTKQIPEKGTVSNINIDLKDLFVITYNEEYNDVRGHSVYDTAIEIYLMKKRIMYATTVASERGAGIPVGTLGGDIFDNNGFLTDASKVMINKITQTLKGIGNAKNAWVVEQVGSDEKDPSFKIRFEELKNQNNNLPMLEYFDRQMLYNTMAQFMLSGIGQNGSRSATSEHKTTYEMFIDYLIKDLEAKIQELSDEMIVNSYLGNLAKEDYPKVKLSVARQGDITVYANTLKNMILSRMLTPTAKDEQMIRDILGLTNYDEDEIEEIREKAAPVNMPTDDNQDNTDNKDETDNEENTEDKQNENTAHCPICLSKQTEPNKEEIEIFELESARETFSSTQINAEIELNKWYEKMIEDIADKYAKSEPLKTDYYGEAFEALKDIFNTGYQKGIIDRRKELIKIGANIKLANDTIVEIGKSALIDKLRKKLTNLWNTTLYSIQDFISGLTPEYIEKNGGIKKIIIDNYTDSEKILKRDVVSFIQEGYTSGRNEEMMKHAKIIDIIQYSAILEGNVCENCAPLHGLDMTIEEAQASGLNTGAGRVNPGCLGRDKCRCQWIVKKLVG